MRTAYLTFHGWSISVNRKLSEIFIQLHISEKSGRDVPKIVETNGRDAVTFEENAIVVTIFFNRVKKAGNKVGDIQKLFESDPAENYSRNEE